jgi:hypothetical protein
MLMVVAMVPPVAIMLSKMTTSRHYCLLHALRYSQLIISSYTKRLRSTITERTEDSQRTRLLYYPLETARNRSFYTLSAFAISGATETVLTPLSRVSVASTASTPER